MTAKARIYVTVPSSNNVRYPRPYPSGGKGKRKGNEKGSAVDKLKESNSPPTVSFASSADCCGHGDGDGGATTDNAEGLEKEGGRGGARLDGRRQGRQVEGGRRGAGGGREGGGRGGIRGGEGGTERQYEVKLVLEENAKWRLAADVLKEIHDIQTSRLAVVYK